MNKKKLMYAALDMYLLAIADVNILIIRTNNT